MLEECDSSEEDAVMFVLSEQGQIQHQVRLQITSQLHTGAQWLVDDWLILNLAQPEILIFHMSLQILKFWMIDSMY